MRSLPGLAALVVTLSACGKLPPVMPYEPAKAEAEIREIEQSWAQVAVSGDPAVIEKIFADDFLGIAPDGTQYGKRDFIEDTKANPLGFRSITLDDMKVRFIGNVAIAQGRETFTKSNGEKGRFVWTDVLERRKGVWVIVAAQDVVAAPGERTAGAALFPGGGTAEAAETSPAVKEIDRTRNDYVEAWKAGDVGRISGLYTDDGVVMYPDQPPVVGRPAISEFFKGFFSEFDALDFQLASSEIVVTDDWAFDRGTYRWKAKPKKGGAPRDDDGKYLVILRRESDGRWRVARDMDNSDRPAAQATRGTP
jgi:uncharacterized protein (TIGR02246 family)